MKRFVFAGIWGAASLLGCVADEDTSATESLIQNPEGSVEAGDAYGYTSVVGDFDGDGIDDLAVGAPDENPNGNGAKVGSVFLYHGRAGTGLGPWTRIDGTIGAFAPNDQFGFALATVRRPNRSCDDLIVGAPGARTNGKKGGAVYVFPCSASGLNAASSTRIVESTGNASDVDDGDRFGAAVAAARVGAKSWLAVGAPGEVTRDHATGYAFVFQLAGATLPTAIYYDKVGNPATFGDNDFGHAVAIGPLYDAARPDLVVGTFNGQTGDDNPDGTKLDSFFNQHDSGDGTVYVYRNDGATFAARRQINDPISESTSVRNRFGYSLAIGLVQTGGHPNQLVVGVPGAPTNAACGGGGNGGGVLVYNNFVAGSPPSVSPLLNSRLAPIPSCGGSSIGYAIAIKQRASSGLATIFATGPASIGDVVSFDHTTQWTSHFGKWGGGVDSSGEVVTALEQLWVSIAAGDFSHTGHLDLVAGSALYSSGDKFASGGLATLFELSPNVWIGGPFIDEGTIFN